MILLSSEKKNQDKSQMFNSKGFIHGPQKFSFAKFFRFSRDASPLAESESALSAASGVQSIDYFSDCDSENLCIEPQAEIGSLVKAQKSAKRPFNYGDVCDLQDAADLDDILSDLFLDETGLSFTTSKFTPDYSTGELGSPQLEQWKCNLESLKLQPVLSRVQSVVLKPLGVSKLDGWNELSKWLFSVLREHLTRRSYNKHLPEFVLDMLCPVPGEVVNRGLLACSSTVQQTIDGLKPLFALFNMLQRPVFEKLVDAYCQLYHPLAGIEVYPTNIYSSETEACIVATSFIQKGQLVPHLVGHNVPVPEEDLERLHRRFSVMNTLTSKQETGKCFVLMGPARFVNHSCLPNVTFRALRSNAIGFEALRDITPGQEIVVSYGLTYWKTGECRCLPCQEQNVSVSDLPKSKRLQALHKSQIPFYNVTGAFEKAQPHCRDCGLPSINDKCARCMRHFALFGVEWPERFVPKVPAALPDDAGDVRVERRRDSALEMPADKAEDECIIFKSALDTLRELVNTFTVPAASHSALPVAAAKSIVVNLSQVEALYKHISPLSLVQVQTELSDYSKTAKAYFCQVNSCLKGFQTVKGIRTHLELAHPQLSDAVVDGVVSFLKQLVFRCSVCAVQLATAESLIKHMRFAHSPGTVSTARRQKPVDDNPCCVSEIVQILHSVNKMDRQTQKLVAQAQEEVFIAKHTSFQVGDAVQVLWSDKYNPEPSWWDAVILKIEWENPITKDTLIYKVHYPGFKSSFDQWVYVSVIRPISGRKKLKRQASDDNDNSKRSKLLPEAAEAVSAASGGSLNLSVTASSACPALLVSANGTSTSDAAKQLGGAVCTEQAESHFEAAAPCALNEIAKGPKGGVSYSGYNLVKPLKSFLFAELRAVHEVNASIQSVKSVNNKVKERVRVGSHASHVMDSKSLDSSNSQTDTADYNSSNSVNGTAKEQANKAAKESLLSMSAETSTDKLAKASKRVRFSLGADSNHIDTLELFIQRLLDPNADEPLSEEEVDLHS